MTEEHLDPDLLAAFADGVLPEHEREQTLAHLAVCPDCRLILSLTLPPFEDQAEPIREAALMRRWFSGWRLAWAAGASFAMLGLFSLLVTRRAPAPVPAPQVAGVVLPQPLPEPVPADKVEARRARPAIVMAPARVAPEPVAPMKAQAGVASAPVQAMARAAAPAPAPAAKSSNTTVEVSAAGAVIDTTTATVMNQSIANLPGGGYVSTYAQGGQMLALDAAGHLFRSTDAGRHYKAVKAAWSGRATRVAAPGDEAPPVPVELARNVAPGPAGTLSGDITDPAGAVVPGAKVEISTAGSGQLQTITADRNGHFQSKALPPGAYQVQAEFPGFQSLRTQVQVAQAEAPPLHLTLNLGAMSETVNVSAAIPERTRRRKAPAVPLFELTTDAGEHWLSVDGKHWKPAQK